MSEARPTWPRFLVLVLAGVLAAGSAALVIRAKTESAKEERDRAEELAGQLSVSEGARVAEKQVQAAAARDLQDRIQALQKQVADLEAAARSREGDLLAARSDAEKFRRVAEEGKRREAALLGDIEKLTRALADAGTGREGPRDASPSPGPAKSPEAPATGTPKASPERPPPVGLSPTAVTDPGQVRKVLDALNTLLAGAGGKETYRVASAEAVEEDRLLRARLEARGEDGSVLKSFRAGEARFLLSASAGTLAIKLKEGEVIYPGDRTVPFLDGTYAILLVVDPAPFRAAGNPLIAIQ